jgi:hypothetical protein
MSARIAKGWVLEICPICALQSDSAQVVVSVAVAAEALQFRENDPIRRNQYYQSDMSGRGS